MSTILLCARGSLTPPMYLALESLGLLLLDRRTIKIMSIIFIKYIPVPL